MEVREKIISDLKKNAHRLKEEFPISSISVFGSILRDDFDEKSSDVDILVDFVSNDIFVFLDLGEELERITKRKVDLITHRSLSLAQKDFLKDKLLNV